MEWHVKAALSPQGDLQLEGPMEAGTPVDLLMAAIAGCFAKSCHMVQTARRETPSAVEVEVTGRKADDPPNRVGHVRIAWRLPGVAPETAAKVARDAKRICTVTNAMSCEFELVEQS